MPDEAAAVFAQHGDRLLYKVRDAARALSLGESKVWELVARGEIESVKIDGARRIRPDAIKAYVERLSNDSRTETAGPH